MILHRKLSLTLLHYVPEYINIQKKLDLSGKKYIKETDSTGKEVLTDNVDYNRTLEFPYQYNINVVYCY